MSAERPVLEQEPREPFNRADCVRHTASNFSPYPSPLVRIQEINLRYQSGEVSVGSGEPYGLDSSVAQRMKQLDPDLELTDEGLKEFIRQEEEARKAFGNTVVTRARELGLVETLNPEQAKASLELAPYVNLAEQVDQQGSDFSFSGWNVLRTKDIDKRVLLVPNRSKEGQVSFETVNLDDLHGRDPKFLPQQVRDYEEKYAMRALANSVTYNLNLHEVPEAELLPEYMREIAQIADPEQRAREIRSMQTFMSWMVRLGDDYKGTIYLFNQTLSRKYIDMVDGRSAYIKSYLEHMAECPTQTEETHQISAELIGAYNAPVGSNAPSDSPFDLQAKDPVIRVLQEPARNTVYLDLAEKRNKADREQDQKVIDFITKTEAITDQTKLLEALQQELPDFHATVVRFQEWLGTDYFKKSTFDKLISETASNILFADEKFDLKQLNDALIKKLGNNIFLATGKFEGVYVNDRNILNERVSLSNPHLKAVLPLMAIKAAQAEAEAKKGDRLMRLMSDDYRERQVQLPKRLTEGLAQFYTKEVKIIDQTLEDIAKNKADVASFKEKIGITDEDIAHLIELATPEDVKDGGNFYYGVYDCLFNALVLKKQGMVNMHSPAFKGLLKSLFPGMPDTVWQNL